MAGDENSTESVASRQARGRRPASTIELSATEVTPSPAAEVETEASAPADSLRASGDDAPSRKRGTSTGRGSVLAFFGAALAGAAVVLVILGGLWQFGFIGVRDPGVADLSSRIQRLEAEATARAEQPAALAKTVGDLSERLAKVEATAAAPQPAAGGDSAVAERLAVIELAEKSAMTRIDDLARRVDATAKALDDITEASTNKSQPPAGDKTDKSEIDRLAARIIALEAAAKERDDRSNAAAAAVPADPMVRTAVLAQALKANVEAGRPFAAELAALKPSAANAKLLRPLEPFAATGVPTAAALGTELAALIPAMSRIAEVPASNGGLLDRLQSGAGRLVRIRPVDEPRSDDPADVMTRIDIKAARADIAGALAELAKLPAPVRAPASAWIAKAEARAAALAAAQQIAVEALATLGKTAP